jgi:hypothetical protein
LKGVKPSVFFETQVLPERLDFWPYSATDIKLCRPRSSRGGDRGGLPGDLGGLPPSKFVISLNFGGPAPTGNVVDLQMDEALERGLTVSH